MSIHLLQMKGEYKHVKTLLEREIFLRCAKHVINRIIKEERGETDLHLAQTVSHCLNCILAPLPFIQAMNSGKIRPDDEAIQNSFQFFPEESIPSPRRNSLSSSPSVAQGQPIEEAKAPIQPVSEFEPRVVSAPTNTNAEQMTKK